MIQIQNNFYELNLIDILYALKNELSLKNVYLFNQIKEAPDNIMVSCPFHKQGQERKPSCGIRKSDGYLHCFTCGETASLEQTISRCFGYNDIGQFGLSWLKNNFLGDITNERIFDLNLSRYNNNQLHKVISEDELETYRYYHPYMFKRKLNEKIINLFDIGYDDNSKCITFPVRDINGNCLFIARRSVIGKFFNYPQNIEKPVYGLYELTKLSEFPKDIYICESMLDALTFWVYNKYAVALNGLGTDYQIKQLNNLPCRKFILATDSDAAGKRARFNLKQKIKYHLVTEIILPNGKKDVNECSENEIKNLLEIF